MGPTGSQASRGKDGSRTEAGLSLVLQPATEFPPAPFSSPAACLEAEVPQLIPESLVVHGSVVLGLTKVLEEGEKMRRAHQYGRKSKFWGLRVWIGPMA